MQFLRKLPTIFAFFRAILKKKEGLMVRKRWKFCLIVLLTLLLFSWKKKPPEKLRVVTHLDISCHHAYGISRWRYTQPEKMEAVLNHLRLRKSLGVAKTDPERLSGDSYRIDISLSDGSHYIYYQRAGRYFSRRCHCWQKTDPSQAAAFSELLRKMPSDPITRGEETRQQPPTPQLAADLQPGSAYPTPDSRPHRK